MLEYILVGAHAVQVGTASFSDPAAAFRIVDELPGLCRRLGIERLDDLRGALKV